MQLDLFKVLAMKTSLRANKNIIKEKKKHFWKIEKTEVKNSEVFFFCLFVLAYKYIVYCPLLKHKYLDFLSFTKNSRRQVCIENLQYADVL